MKCLNLNDLISIRSRVDFCIYSNQIIFWCCWVLCGQDENESVRVGNGNLWIFFYFVQIGSDLCGTWI